MWLQMHVTVDVGFFVSVTLQAGEPWLVMPHPGLTQPHWHAPACLCYSLYPRLAVPELLYRDQEE